MGRTPCCDKNGLKKGPWTPEEDQKLIVYIQKHGHGRWRTLPRNAGLSRCGKSCRLRWTNYLRPDVKRGKFSLEEEETIIQLHRILGNKWSAIAARLPGRTDNEIKNFWNTHIRKRLLRMGIDPVTHGPRLDLSSLLTPSPYDNTFQTEFPGLLGVDEPSVINAELLRIAAGLLSAQRQDSDELLNQNSIHLQQQLQQQKQRPHLPQFDQHQRFLNPIVQGQFDTSSFSAHQLPDPVQQIPICKTSATAAAMHAGARTAMPESMGQVLPSETFPCGLPMESLFMPHNCEPLDRGAQTMVEVFGLKPYEATDHVLYEPSTSRNESFGFPSGLPTTVPSIPTALYSSSMYVHNTGIMGEDERDGYWNSVLNRFRAPEFLQDVDAFM